MAILCIALFPPALCATDAPAEKSCIAADPSPAASPTASPLPIDPRSYGAKGDGVTYDTAALQRAIDVCGGTGGSVQTVIKSASQTVTIRIHEKEWSVTRQPIGYQKVKVQNAASGVKPTHA